MSDRRTRHRPRTGQPAPHEPDTTELELGELLALWPRLEDALARDGAGPSAAPTSGGSGSQTSSPAPLDTDTADTMVVIATGVQAIAAEAIALLRITPPRIRVRQLNALIAAQEQRRATARAEFEHARHREHDLDDVERAAAHRALETAIDAADEIGALRNRIARVHQRASTFGLIEVMPTWYARLRDAGQPLADHIEQDARRWVRSARSALRLRTPEVRIGWRCPHHREQPAELVRDRDEATLNPAVLAGGRAGEGIAPLLWRRSESVHCPRCGTRWSGVEQLRVLMKMIEQADRPVDVDDLQE